MWAKTEMDRRRASFPPDSTTEADAGTKVREKEGDRHECESERKVQAKGHECEREGEMQAKGGLPGLTNMT